MASSCASDDDAEPTMNANMKTPIAEKKTVKKVSTIVYGWMSMPMPSVTAIAQYSANIHWWPSFDSVPARVPRRVSSKHNGLLRADLPLSRDRAPKQSGIPRTYSGGTHSLHPSPRWSSQSLGTRLMRASAMAARPMSSASSMSTYSIWKTKSHRQPTQCHRKTKAKNIFRRRTSDGLSLSCSSSSANSLLASRRHARETRTGGTTTGERQEEWVCVGGAESARLVDGRS